MELKAKDYWDSKRVGFQSSGSREVVERQPVKSVGAVDGIRVIYFKDFTHTHNGCRPPKKGRV